MIPCDLDYLNFCKLQTKNCKLRIGILAIHGDIAEHADILRQLNLEPVEVRAPEDFEKIEGLILPGGESTTIGDLAETYGLRDALIKFATTPLQKASNWNLKPETCSLPPVLATCAGLILLAKFGLLNVEVERNAYGRQLDSFETELNIPAISKKPLNVAFIRAPKITKTGKGVEVLARFEQAPVLVKQDNLWGMSFHPEITGETAIHKFIFGKK